MSDDYRPQVFVGKYNYHESEYFTRTLRSLSKYCAGENC